MDPFSLIAGSVGTLGVLAHSTKVLIDLVRDVKGAPAEVLTTAETAQALEKELLNITTEVENGRIPGAVVSTSDKLLLNCSAAVTKLTIKLKPHIEAAGTGRQWRSRMKWAVLDKSDVVDMLARLEHNKTSLLLGLTSFGLAQSRQQAEGLSTKLGSLETLAKDQHATTSANAANIHSGIERLDIRMVENDREVRERYLQFAASQKAQTDMLAMLLAQQAQQASQFSQLQQQFISNKSDNSNNYQNASTKADQLRELTAQVKYDPLDALRTWYEGSTIVESYPSKHDIANLETLEEDYMISEEPDDIAGDFVKCLEERIEEYGGMDDTNATLLSAVIAGDKDVTTALLEADADINARNQQRRTPLILAASDDQKLITRILLEYNAEINAYDELGLTALHVACMQGFHAMCTILIKGGADIEAKSLEGDTPLRAALKAERPHIVQLLLEQGCNAKTLGSGGESMLHLVVENASAKGGSIALVRVLLDGKVDPNLKTSTTGRTSLHLAAEKGNIECIALLLKSKANIDALDDNLDTALLVAARAEKSEAVKLLVEGGADVNRKTSGGLSALNEAAQRHTSTAVVQALLTGGADVETSAPGGHTPFLRAARWSNTNVLKVLSKVSNTKAADDNGNTAMHFVAWIGNVETAKLLVDDGADLTARDKWGKLPLHQAANCSNVKVLEFLLDQGTDIESPGNKAGFTAIHYATHNGNIATLTLLLDRQADIEAYIEGNEVHATPLLRAVVNNKLEIARFLLNKGANISAKGTLKYSGLHICAWKGFPEMAALLLQSGALVDIESLDGDGMTPLLRAAWNSKEPLAQLFIDRGANVGAQRPQGDNAFRVFSRTGIKSLPLFKRLADEETDINAVDETGCVPVLHLAVGGQPQIVAAALERGADIHALNPYGLTPLSHAARLGFKDIVVMLLDAGADIDHNTNNGLNNPLLLAATNGHVAVLKVLIARGADLDVKNANGQSALAVALAAKQGPAVVLLSTLGAFIQPSMTIHEAVKSGDALNVEMLLSNNPAAIDEVDDKQRTPLHNVLFNNGKLAMLELLLRSGANVGAQDVNGFTPLMIAVHNNYGDAVAKILERKPDMSLKTVKKWSAMHYTKRHGSRYIAKLLVAHGAPLDDAEAVLGSTPLHLAAAFGSLDVVRFLLESGANREAKDNNKSTPLLRAICSNQVAVAEYLLEQGASIFVKSEPYQLSAILLTATWTNSEHLAKLLFNRGAELEDRDNEELTPLVRSAFNLKEAVFHLLLEKGANLESLDIYGRTALQRACLTSLEKTVKLLLRAKPMINFKDEKNGMTALHYAAATTNTRTEICQLLLDHGAELDGIDNFGSTPVFKALYQNNMKLLGYLAERGAKLELQDNEGFTVLHRAVRGELKPAVSVILELGADIHAKTRAGLGIFHIAAISNKDPDITLELLRKGMAIEEKDRDGNTPLLRAAINGKTGVVKVLLEHGAETEVRNLQSQNTPLLHAIAKSHISAAQCLVENGAHLSAETNGGWQAIHEAIRFAAKPVILMLIDRSQLEIAVDRPSSQAMHGLRPLHIAVRETMNAEIIKMLVEKGADIEARTHLQLQTPFLNITETRMSGVAKTEKEMLAMAKLLVNLGADVRATDNLGNNLLFGAARERAVSLFEFLLEKGLSIDSESATGVTVLQVAAIGGKTETVKYLLEKGADKLHQSNIGKTALHMAVSWGRLDAVKLLATIRGQELDIKDNDNKTPLDLARACMYGNRKEATIELREKAKKNADDIYNCLFYLRYPACDL